MAPLEQVVALSALLFVLGALGALLRRNIIVVLMCIELMLGASVLALVAFSRQWADATGQLMALVVLAVGAVQLAVGVAILVALFRNRGSTDVEDASLLRW